MDDARFRAPRPDRSANRGAGAAGQGYKGRDVAIFARADAHDVDDLAGKRWLGGHSFFSAAG